MSNKFTGLKVSIFSLVLMLLSVSITNAQVWVQATAEQFPNTFNTSATGPINSTFVGNMGTWGAYSNKSYAKVTVTNYNYLYTNPNSASLRIYPGASAANAQITSPTINLSAYACSEKFDISTNFNFDKLTANTGTIFYIEISNNNGATWTILYQKTATQLKSDYPGSGYHGLMMMIPNSFLVSTFKFRYRLYQPAGSTYDSEIRFDDLEIGGWPCREFWDNLCVDNKIVDFYSKGMKNSCVNGTMGWTNIGSTEGLNMTNATKAIAYVSMNETYTPGQTVTIRSKNSSGTVIQTQTATLKANHSDPSTMNIYEATFTTSLSSVASFEATISGSCSLTNEYNPNYVANGFGISVQRTGVSGYENKGHNIYWGSPGYGTGDYWQSFSYQPVAYQRTALATFVISGLIPSKGVRLKVWPQSLPSYTVDVLGNDTQFGDRITTVTIPVTISANDTYTLFSTDYAALTNNGMYSIDMVKFEVPCSNSLKIGNIVFNDANNNGVKDGAETGIANTKVYLFRDANLDNVPDGQPIQITTTDASGNYYFDGLLAGSYIVGVKIPNGYSSGITTGTSSNPNNDTDNDNNGVTYNATSGLLLSNYITLSVGGEPTTDGDADNNSNLSLDFGLKTNACVKTTENFPNTFNTGYSSPINAGFTGSSGGWWAWSKNTYSTVVVETPFYSPSTTNPPAIKLVGYAIGCANADGWAEASSPIVNVSANCCPLQTTLNFTLWTYVCNANDRGSYFAVRMSGDGGTTWTTQYQMTAEEMVNTYGTNGKVQLSVPIPTSLQTTNFKYSFVLYSQWNSGYNFYVFVDDATISSPVTCGTGSIGDYVWNDANMNGSQDAGETAISGVTVILRDSRGSEITRTTTNASGNYTFTNVPAGTYQVSFVTPAGYNPTWNDYIGDDTKDSDPIGGTIKNVTLTTGQVRTDIDAGFFPICSTLFSETFPNTYNTGWTTPTNGTFTGDLGTWTVSSSNGYAGLTVENNSVTTDNYIRTINYYDGSGSLGQVILTSPTLNVVQGTPCTQWTYLNFEMTPDYINTPVGSDSYKVYVDFSGDGGSTWSNAWAMNGADIVQYYGLCQKYNVSVSLTPAVYTSTFKFRIRTEQQSGAYCDNYILFDNFQVRKCPCPPLTLGNLVWFDANNNGIKDASESGMSGVTVKLYNDNDGNNWPDGAAVATTTTNASGIYSFGTLVPGNYIVGVMLPTGYVTGSGTATSSNPNNDIDNDNNGVVTIPGPTPEVRSNSITLTVGNEPAIGVDGDGTNGNLTLDIGLKGTLNLGNSVWYDVNNNGIKDASETGVSGATVKLYQDANADNTPDGVAVATTTTNASGLYSFTNLPAGNYIVGVTLPTGYVATVTTANSATPNSDTDNDNNGVTTVSGELRSNYITLSVGGEPSTDGDGTNGNLTLDFGLKGSLNLGNLIWNDTNGNGIKDAFESGINGVTVYLYLDANGDNVPDGAAITSTTTAGGGIYSFTNLVPGNYIVGYQLPTGYANSYKPTNNANPNSDTDGDNNGVTTASGIVRSNYITLSVGGEPSTDGDGTNGNLTLDFGCAKDTDGDGVPDVIDIDDDNDGITDVKESGGYDPLADCDNDGVPNYLDSTPGCTTPSGNDAWGNPFTPLTWSDCNSDGINDFFDKDRDGIINELDLDADNDGILDVQEARPGGVAVGSTSNGQITGTDADADGLLSSQDNNQASPYNDGIAAQDLDRDGIPNFLDLDSDGDGINDLTEALNTYDADGIVSGTDTDGDGVRAESFGSSAASIADNINGLGAKGISLLDSDADGKPNTYDIDSDADGITDNAEAQATCTYILPTGTDCDKDGVDDAYEAGGNCSCAGRTTAGVTPYDKDGDSTPDYLDTDTDGDGVTDIYEGNNIKTSNYWTGSMGDADSDGLIDYFDIFNIVNASSNYFRNVVNRNMGTNGSLYTGVGGDGSGSHLPESDGKDCSTGGDRDWRMITILPTTLLNFNGSLDNAKVAHINWVVTNEINMNSYTLERSVDGVNFTVISNKTAINSPNLSSIITYNAEDNLSNVNNAVVYYRLRMTDKNNNVKYSNIISFKLYDKGIVGVTVYPNPAKSSFTLKLTSEKDENVQVRIVDKLGKEIMSQKTQIMKGVNNILFNDISMLASGVYMIQIYMNGEVYTERLIVAK